MNFWKKPAMFLLGGTAYVAMELLWRGRSHASMFLAGGLCFLLLGGLNHAKPKLSLPVRAVVGSAVVTGVELAIGMVANRDYSVWDYRGMPANFMGQICLTYSLLWIPVSLAALLLYELLEVRLPALWRRRGHRQW